MNRYAIERLAAEHQAELVQEAAQHALGRSAHASRSGPGVSAMIGQLAGRYRATLVTLVRRDHSLTDYPCRLPDGSIGRVAVIHQGGDWALVCRVA